MLHGRRRDRVRPAGPHLLDRAAEVPEGLERRPGVGGDLRIDLAEAQIHRPRDPPAAHVPRLRRNAKLRAQARGVARVGARDCVLHQRAVRDAARQRPLVTVGVEVERRVLGHAPMGRLEADHAAARCRDADRSPDVRARGQAARPRRERGPGATGRASRTHLGIPRVARDAPQARVRHAGARELGGRGARVDDGARPEQPLHRGRGPRGGGVAQEQ